MTVSGTSQRAHSGEATLLIRRAAADGEPLRRDGTCLLEHGSSYLDPGTINMADHNRVLPTGREKLVGRVSDCQGFAETTNSDFNHDSSSFSLCSCVRKEYDE